MLQEAGPPQAKVQQHRAAIAVLSEQYGIQTRKTRLKKKTR